MRAVVVLILFLAGCKREDPCSGAFCDGGTETGTTSGTGSTTDTGTTVDTEDYVYSGELDLVQSTGQFFADGEGCRTVLELLSPLPDGTCGVCTFAYSAGVGSVDSGTSPCPLAAEVMGGVVLYIGHVEPAQFWVGKNAYWQESDYGMSAVVGDLWQFRYGPE